MLLHFCLLLLFCLVALVLVGVLVVYAVVEVLIVELLIGAVKLPDANAEAQDNVLVFHKRRTDLNEARLLGGVTLPRVEGAQDDTARRAILQQTSV